MTDPHEPMLPEEGTRAPFTSPGWIYELQFDGTRCIARVEPGDVGDTARVRITVGARGDDPARPFPEVVQALARLPGGPHVLDGTAGATHASGDALCVSDLIVHAGEDITAQPLLARQARLRELIHSATDPRLMPAGSLPADAGLLRAMTAASPGPVTVIAKRKDSPYRCGQHSPDWLRIDPQALPGPEFRPLH